MPYLKREVSCPEPLDCRILTAALNLFVEKGYHNVSVHEVQKNADASIGSIYKHFGGKEGIANALYSHILNEFDELIDGITNEIESPVEQYKEIIKQLFEHTETHSNIIAYIFHDKHTDFLPNKPLMSNTKPFLRIKNIIIKGIERKEIQDTDSWIATSLIFGSAIRMIQLRLDNLLEKPLPDYYEMIIERSWNGIKPTS